jgi:transposase
MNDMNVVLGRWQLDVKQVRERVYRAPTPRERERWHAVWLLARGWSTEQVAEALERDVRTIEDWATDFEQRGSAGLSFDQSGGPPPPSVRHSKRN